jgi:hypothetical protein
MPESKQPAGRVRRWLDKRRASRLRRAEGAQRAKAVRKHDADRAARHGPRGSGDPGSFGGF